MISSFFHTIIYQPLYNALVFLLSVVPYADVGIAVIVLTVIVKFILFPLSQRAMKTQAVVRKINPQLQELKKTHKDDPQEQARQTIALYKKHGVHPLSGFLTLFIQLPIIIGLYFVFWRGGLPDIDVAELYRFVSTPEEVKMAFLGLVPMDGRSFILAALAGITQFIHARMSIPVPEKRGSSLADDITYSINLQMKYILPVIVAGIAYTISAAVALYLTTSNLFSIAQERIVRRKLAKEEAEAAENKE